MLSEQDFNNFVEELGYEAARKNFVNVLSKINSMMGFMTPEMKARCLLLQGEIKQEQGLYDNARQDWKSAVEYCRDGSYLRYLLECEIGSSLQKENRQSEASDWYHKALESCAKGDFFSGNNATVAFLKLHDGKVPSKDKPLVATVVEKSWKVLELSGSPDLANLPQAITLLSEGLEGKIRVIKEQVDDEDEA